MFHHRRRRSRWDYAAMSGRSRRRTPSWALILLAGLAGVALAKLMSADNREQRSTAQKALIGVLIVVIGAVVLSLRSRAYRYRW
jgi:hypothetical protein